jgi:hypothetical protein
MSKRNFYFETEGVVSKDVFQHGMMCKNRNQKLRTESMQVSTTSKDDEVSSTYGTM